MRTVRLALVGALLVVSVPAVARAQDGTDQIDAARAAVEAGRVEVEAAQERANRAGEAYFAAIEAGEALGEEIARVEAHRAVLDAELAELRAEVREIAVTGYVRGNRLPDVLVDADINVHARRDAMVRIVTSTRADALDDYRVARLELAEVDAELEARSARQRELVAQAEVFEAQAFAELETLGAAQADLEARLAELEEAERVRAAEEARRLEEARLAEAERRAAEEARRQAEQLALATPTPASSPTAAPTAAPDGDPASPPDDPPAPEPTPTPEAPPPGDPPPVDGWVCPVAGPTSFIDSWGAPRAYGRWHKGTDMMAEEGVPVVAVVNGTVEHRGNSVGGLSAHLTADNGAYFYYTHLSGYAQDGYVTAGTVIGYVGQTGNATTPHLHFEHHPDGQGGPVNPYPTLIQYC